MPFPKRLSVVGLLLIGWDPTMQSCDLQERPATPYSFWQTPAKSKYRPNTLRGLLTLQQSFRA